MTDNIKTPADAKLIEAKRRTDKARAALAAAFDPHEVAEAQAELARALGELNALTTARAAADAASFGQQIAASTITPLSDAIAALMCCGDAIADATSAQNDRPEYSQGLRLALGFVISLRQQAAYQAERAAPMRNIEPQRLRDWQADAIAAADAAPYIAAEAARALCGNLDLEGWQDLEPRDLPRAWDEIGPFGATIAEKRREARAGHIDAADNSQGHGFLNREGWQMDADEMPGNPQNGSAA